MLFGLGAYACGANWELMHVAHSREYLDVMNELKKDDVPLKYVAVPWEEMAENPGARDLAEMFCFYTDYDKQCIRDVNATKKLYPGLGNFREYAKAAAAEGKL
jgi:hypothetical protein